MINELCCPVCNSIKIAKFFEKKDVPVHQNYIFKQERSAININKGDLKLYICKECAFVFNATFDINKLQYSELYDNSQEISDVFNQYIEDEIDFLIDEFEIKEKRIIEVGCGKGHFIKKLALKSNSIGIGYDTSYVGDDEVQDGRVKFNKCFYDKSCTDVQADIVICRHVIEHVPDPVDMLQNIRMALSSSPNAKVFFETPSVKWILENKVIYDFFYEHCSYFDVDSITKAFNIAGFTVERIVHEFNGQYMWIIGEVSKNSEHINESSNNEVNLLEKLAYSYNSNSNRNIEKWKAKIIDLTKIGKVAIWGAGAKGVTFVNLIDPEKKYIDSVIDININKQRGYLPGTGHEIISFDEIINREIKTVILMNSNYLEEIIKVLDIKKIKVDLICGEDLL